MKPWAKTTILYTVSMSHSLISLSRALDAALQPGGVDERMGVDSVIAFDEFAVPGHPEFVTVVVVPLDSIPTFVQQYGTVPNTAVATGADKTALRLLAEAGVSALVVTPFDDRLVQARLVSLIAADQAAEDRLVTIGTKVLTQVARSGGAQAVVVELARRIDGWTVLLDPHGQLIASASAGALHLHDAVSVAFNRLVRVRHPGLQVHPVGLGEDLSGYLVISSRDVSKSRSRDLASQAAALLDLVLRVHEYSATERLGREVMIARVLAGGTEAQGLLRRWGVRDLSLTAFMLSARTRSVDVERLITRWCDELSIAHVFTDARPGVLGFVPDDSADALAARVERFVSESNFQLRLGLGSSAPSDALASSASEARQAHEAATSGLQTVVWYRALPTVQYVLDRLDRAEVVQVAAVLGPLRLSHAQLLDTLRVYLKNHGSWGVSAEELGIHRQTLLKRIRRIEDLTGLSMESPDDRSSAWLAFRALEHIGPATE